MKILVIASYLPYPLFSGGDVRLYNILKQLAKKHKITLICESRSYQTEKDKKEIEKFCEEVITVSRIPQWSIKNIFKTAFSFYPFLMIGHTNSQMKKEIVMVLAKKSFDVIHVETFYVFQNLPKTYIPIVLIEHNIEYLVYQKFMSISPFLIRPLLAIDILKMKYWENVFWKTATKVVAVSEKEKRVMQRADAMVVANGVDLNTFSYRDPTKVFNKKEKKILFIGNFKWIQNRQSIEWIIKDIWPKIQQKYKQKKLSGNLTLWVVGKNIPETIKNLEGTNIVFDENAPNETQKIFKESFALISPIIVGGGTSYKILEAMATGVPVVTTPLGIDGLKVKKDQDILVESDSNHLADSIISLVENSVFYTKISRNGRSCIEKHYTWEMITKILEDIYKEVTS